jgi:hypothetical protein
MAAERSDPTEEAGRIIRFRPRAPDPSQSPAWPDRVRPKDPSPVDDLGRFARGGDDDDYPHRMTMNALAFLACFLLAVAAVWLADQLAEMRKNQDCVLSGRPGCTKVDFPPRER